jgi:hypothetical protein
MWSANSDRRPTTSVLDSDNFGNKHGRWRESAAFALVETLKGLEMRCGTLILGILLLAGCGGASVTPNPDPVDVTVTLTAGGKPVNDVKFNFQPTDAGLPAVVDVKDGKVQTNVTPGKYTWFVSAGKTETALNAIPAQYHAGALERQFEVSGGETLELALD